MSEISERRFSPRQQLLCGLILIALILITFSPLAHCDFVQWDDYQTVAKNPAFNPVRLSSILNFWSPTNPYMDLYVPATYTFWGALAAIASRHAPDSEGLMLSPAVFHLANVLMHACSTIFVWRILRRLVRDDLAAFAGAAIFALHPLQVETIAWISGGKDVLSGMLCLLALWMYLLFAQAGVRNYYAYGAATFAFMLAVLAKPQAVALPVVVLVIDCMILRRSLASVAKSLVFWFAWCIPVILIGRQAQSASLLESPVAFRPIVALDAIAFYIGRMFWPAALVIDYGRSPHWLLDSVDRFWTWMVPIALLAGCWALRKRARWPLISILMFIAALLPMLGLVGFDFQTYSTVADHYTYLALLAPAFAVAVAASQIPGKKWLPAAVIVLILLHLASYHQCEHWRDTRTLFEYTYEVNPSSLAAAGMLGMYWDQHGDRAQALGILKQSCDDHPTVPFAHFTYANVLQDTGLIRQALLEYKRAIELDASKAEYYRNFGVALDKSGHPELAAVAFARGAQLSPKDPDNFKNAGLALMKIGRLDEARNYLVRAQALDPSRTDIREALAVLAAQKPSGAPSHSSTHAQLK